MDRLGIADEYRERRESIADRLSPSAKHQAFPGIYARPLPREATKVVDPTPPLRAEIAALKAELADERREVARLNVLLTDLSKPVGERTNYSPEAVMVTFCECMAAFGVKLGDYPWTLRELKDVARGQAHARPRQVCMWLVKRLCPSSSLPSIGKLFGNRDHTTVMHAVRRAPEVMGEDPALRQVAMAVLQTFGGTTP